MVSAFAALFFMLAAPVQTQTVPFESDRWRWSAAEHRIEEHLGRPSLFLKQGIATVADARFTDGWFEFDIAMPDERGFMGGIWRFQKDGAFEDFYLRAHQSGNPDATQYTPVFNGVSAWQLYHGERYTVPLVHRFNEWVHVKIAFSGSRAEIYVGDAGKPALVIDELKRSPEAGSVGLKVGRAAGAHFSNFSYTVADGAPLRAAVGAAETAPPGVIPSWQVSDAFAEAAVDGKTALGPGELAERRWTRLEAERSGIANLARIQGIDGEKNTVFARRAVVSQREQIKRLDFGFSDRVRVYLNGRLLFRGDDAYLSRDYRFLGSIGYFDSLYLPLVKGENEIVLAVSEDAARGGWGIQAKLEDLAGLDLKD